jgi:hypothetical protein
MPAFNAPANADVTVATAEGGDLALSVDPYTALFTLKCGGDAHLLNGVNFESTVLLNLLQKRGLNDARVLEIRRLECGPQFAVIREPERSAVAICLPPVDFDAAKAYIADLPDVPLLVLKHEVWPNLVFLSQAPANVMYRGRRSRFTRAVASE